jgi:Contractile injection system tape measure protein
VQRKAVDVLIDQIPWSISTIVHAWIPLPTFVTWRRPLRRKSDELPQGDRIEEVSLRG